MDNSIGSSIIDETLGKNVPDDELSMLPGGSAPPIRQSIGSGMIDEMLTLQDVEDRLAVKENSAVDAARQAEAVRLGKQMNVPSSTAYNQLDQLRQEQTQRAMDEKRQNYPAWSSVLSDHDLGPIAQDPANAADLQFIEDKFGALKGPAHSLPGDLVAGWYNFLQGEASKDVANAAEDLTRLKEGKQPRWAAFSPGGMPMPQLTPEQQQAKISGELVKALANVEAADKAAAQFPESDASKTFFKPDTPYSFLLTHPQLLIEIPTRSLIASAPSAVGAAAGFALGGPAGGALGAFAGSANVEFSSTIHDELAKRGADFGDPKSVMEIWQKDGEQIVRKAETRAGVVGLFDAASAFIGGKIGGHAVEGTVKQSLLQLIGKEFLGVGTDMALGAGGEAAAEVASGDQLDGKQIAAEALGELGPGIIQTTTAIHTEAKRVRAEAAHKELISLGDRIRASKTMETSPETILAHAQAIDESGNGPAMSAPAEALLKLFQSENFTPEMVASAFPEVAQALDEAADTNAEVPLPARTVVQLAQFPGFNELSADIRSGPDELTAREAKDQGADLEQTLAGMSEEDKRAAVFASVEAEAAKAIAATGQDPKAAATMARVHASILMNLAEKNKINLEDLVNRYKLKITGNQKINLEDLVNQYKLEITGNQNTNTTTDGTTLNQGGQTETPEFKTWFGDSKVVDEKGAPLVVYHGTNRAPNGIAVFDTRQTDETGTHFGTADQANMFAEGGGAVYPVYLKIRNPLRLRDLGGFLVDTVGPQLDELGIPEPKEPNLLGGDYLRARIKEAGYDGVVYLNRREGGHNPFGPDGVSGDELDAMTDDEVRETFPEASDSYIAFDPTQIKSATGNSGTFDPNNPNILYQSADPPVEGQSPTTGSDQQDAVATDNADAVVARTAASQTSEAPSGASSASGTTLNQGGKDTRGSISFTTARDKFTITLTGKADLSTFMHEAGHYYLEVIQDLVAKGMASPELVADLEKIRAWMGLKPGEAIEVRHHEMFARGFEAYLMEGRAPSAELQGAFNRLRAWMVFIYKRLSALDVDLTDEVRGVFDRLVASDEAIAEARTNIGWSKPLPKEALHLTDEEYDRYVEAWNKANEEQQREVDARLMLEAAREAQQAWKDERRKVFDEEKAKVEQSRGWRAWRLLSAGEGLEDAAPGRTSLKIDPTTVPSDWSRDAAGMTEEGGLPLDVVAEILGFNSGDEMMSVIAGARGAMRDLPVAVKQIMFARHGDLDATALADLATAAVQSDKTHEVLLTEYRAMAEKAGLGGAPKGMLQWMAGQAKQKVLGLTRRQLDPVRWRRAQLKAAAESAKAAAKGDMTTAAIKKRQQMMAAAMERASLRAEDRIETIRKKLLPFTKNDRRAKLGKAGDLYLDAIDEILEGIQLKNMSATSVMKLDRLQKLVEEADAKGEPLQLPDKLRAMLGKKNFADMTLEELEGVHDTVMNIWHLAKTKNELRARAETREMDSVLTEMEANAQAAMGDPKIREGFIKSKLDKYAGILRWGRAQLVKMEFLFGWLDGKPAGGLMHRYIYQPIADANREEYKILGRLNRDLFSRLRKMPKEQKARWNRKLTFMGEQANGATIIAAALNLGNESNRQKLLEGYGWNEQRLMAEINAFMTKADWDVVQHIWDQIDTLWPQIEETTRLATGLRPEKVTGTPVVTPFGTYAGGYYPVVYDPNRTEQQFKNQQSAEGLFSNNFVRPTLGDGFTKARVNYAAPILLDLSVISRHLSEVVHFVTHYQAITQADKISRHPRFQNIVKGHMGNEFYREIRPWLQDIARAQDSPAVTQREILSTGAKYLRGGMSISQMGYNLFTGMKQLFGVVTTLDAVGPLYWMSGLQKAWLSPKAAENWRFAMKESAELEPLITSFDRDIKMINDTYAKSIAGGVVDASVQYAFAHIGYFQLAVNVAAWHGAYEQALAKGLDHEGAVKEADAVVRQTQSSGAIKDLSAVQRGSEASRMVSLFYSFFSVLYNRLEDINRQTKSIGDVPKAARRLAVLIFMSAMIDETSKRAWDAVGGGDGKDDDKNGFILSVLLKSADMMIASVPLVRGFISAEYMFGGGFKPEAAPIWRVGEDVFRAAAGVKHLVTKGEMTKGEAKAALRAVSVATRLPLYGAANSVMSIYELASEMLGGSVKK